MKRYRSVMIGSVRRVMTEDVAGTWVRWEDVEDMIIENRNFKAANAAFNVAEGGLQDEIRRLKTTTITGEDGILKVRDVTECSCADMATGTMAKYPNMLMADWWVCPKHGYKKR